MRRANVLADAEGDDPVAAFRISSARISPSGPDPCTLDRSIRFSAARRRALGEILIGFPAAGATEETAEAVTAAEALVVFLPVSTRASSPGGASPGRTIHAIVC